MSETPRAYTREEIQDILLEHIDRIVEHWTNADRYWTIEGRIRGACHSLLVILDGESADMPAFSVKPAPCAEDEEYRRECGENWYPSDVDIAGNLHDRLAASWRKDGEQR